MEAGFMRVVEVGQYFMTKNNGDFKQFRSVACREYTLPRDDPASQPKGWILGDMRIGLVLEVVSSQQILLNSSNFLAITSMVFLEEPISQFQLSIQTDFVSLSLICPSTCLM